MLLLLFVTQGVSLILLIRLTWKVKSMVDKAALDSAIAALKAAIDAIVAKLGTVTNVDFTTEVDSLSAATTEIQNALNPQ